jgi:murein DD-endopeptidase MepM/ murein hydrolase activator NlpD
MGRLLLFLAGIATGAAGMYLLVQDGWVRGPVRAQPRVATPSAPTLPVTSGTMPAPAPTPTAEPQPAPPASAVASSPAVAPVPAPAMPAVAATVAAPSAGVFANPGQSLLVPVQGVQATQLVDTFTQARGTGRLHDAIDIMAARGTPVLAVADGRVAKLFDSKPGGLTVYQFDRAEKLAYYYAHLDRYAPGLAEGQQLRRGEVLGYVGSTGNASETAPHLHFAIFVLGPDKRWWQGTAINPYPLLRAK